MGLGVKGTYEDPQQRDRENIISIEIGSDCNLKCPKCITSNRRLSKESDKRYSCADDLVELLINYFPGDSVPIFIGLGEPTHPLAQDGIVKFLSQRDDIKKAHIQTNGSFKLEPGLVELFKNRNLSMGLSYDNMHQLGGQKNYMLLDVQPEFVSGIAIAIDGNEKPVSGFDNHFKNLNRILIHPSINGNNEFASTWDQLKQSISNYSEIYPNQVIYSDLSEFFKESNPGFFDLAKKELIKTNDDWKFHKELNFFIYMPRLNTNGMRFLVNGKYTLKAEESVNKVWSDLEKETFPINTLLKYNF